MQGLVAQPPAGYAQFLARLTALGVPPERTPVAMEAAGIYWENLDYVLQAQHYQW